MVEQSKINPSAALLIIGNEILSGRTQDSNLKYLAETLLTKGIKLIEARVIPDIEFEIMKAVTELRTKVDYLFTTGGIGPTHDDITAECMAKAFNVPLELNSNARSILLSYYGSESELTEARLKMAMIPVGASLISNPVSGAPGFKIENVHVMAGVPRIMQAMLDDVMMSLIGGELITSMTVGCNLGESVLAKRLTVIQDHYPSVEIGSYPQFRNGAVGVSLVTRGTDKQIVNEVKEKIKSMIIDLGGEIKSEF
jgi:molybdenum cofactor synthesis domain-containing protein